MNMSDGREAQGGGQARIQRYMKNIIPCPRRSCCNGGPSERQHAGSEKMCKGPKQ